MPQRALSRQASLVTASPPSRLAGRLSSARLKGPCDDDTTDGEVVDEDGKTLKANGGDVVCVRCWLGRLFQIGDDEWTCPQAEQYCKVVVGRRR